MSPWLPDNLKVVLPLALSGTGLLGLIAAIVRLSVKQSVRLYQADLVQCRKEREGDAETMARQEREIDFLTERSAYHDRLMEELHKEQAENRIYTSQLLDMIQQQTTPRRRSRGKSRPPDGSETI